MTCVCFQTVGVVSVSLDSHESVCLYCNTALLYIYISYNNALLLPVNMIRHGFAASAACGIYINCTNSEAQQ